jgi:hypothetical protein
MLKLDLDKAFDCIEWPSLFKRSDVKGFMVISLILSVLAWKQQHFRS